MAPPAKPSRVDVAYQRLKADIRTNRLPPGHQEPEPELAARLGMSRTPVREALIRLEAEGLVELTPRRGARVLPIRTDDMLEIYDILTALEPEAAANVAARNPDEDTLAPITTAMEEMEAALEAEDLDSWAEADERFHLALLELNGNARLMNIITALSDQAHRARMITLRIRGTPVQSTEDHRQILACLRAGDAEGARRVFRAHRQRVAQELLTILDTYKLGQL